NFDVVVVETNHRLGLLGYLFLDEVAGEDYKGSGNNGLLDIIDGLKWVNANISMFGGNPENVMIFGESGGGAKTSCLYAMPDATPYFNKASIESGPGIRMIPEEVASETTALLFRQLNISSSGWQKLLELPASDLLELQVSLPKAAGQVQNQSRYKGIVAPRAGNFAPVVDGEVLPVHPFDPVAPEISRNKPLLIGWNEDEYTFFAAAWGDVSGLSLDFDGLHRKLEPQFGKDTDLIISTYRETRPKASASNIFVEIMSETLMGLGSVEIAEKKAGQKGAPVFLYNFGFKSHNKVPNSNYELGTPHAMDITFKFNNVVPEGLPKSITMSGDWPGRIKASQNFAEFWTTFAKTGTPAAAGQPYWADYTLKRRPTMRIDTACEIIYNRYRVEREMWRSLGYIG
ncbi:MAG: carboxylesterase family protein, partial [Bacteroidota bacterium]|nr:carboxylesterase family protein [Bacteroidota bacterium]